MTSDTTGAAFKEALRKGQPKMGLFINSHSPTVAEQLAHSGYDWLLVDTQHGPMDSERLSAMLAAIGLRPKSHAASLYHPPSSKKFWLKTSGFWERLGGHVSNRFAGGVLLVEVTKQVPAPPRTGLPEAIRRPLRVLDGIKAPEPKPI